MKKVILAFVCIAGFALVSFAQNTTPAKADVAAQRASSLDQMVSASKTAGLDEKQINKAKEVLENLYKKQDEIKSDTTLTTEARTKKLKDANADKDWKLQYAMGDKWLAYVEARKKMAAEAAAKKP